MSYYARIATSTTQKNNWYLCENGVLIDPLIEKVNELDSGVTTLSELIDLIESDVSELKKNPYLIIPSVIYVRSGIQYSIIWRNIIGGYQYFKNKYSIKILKMSSLESPTYSSFGTDIGYKFDFTLNTNLEYEIIYAKVRINKLDDL